jgi:hypothetical protein
LTSIWPSGWTHRTIPVFPPLNERTSRRKMERKAERFLREIESI